MGEVSIKIFLKMKPQAQAIKRGTSGYCVENRQIWLNYRMSETLEKFYSQFLGIEGLLTTGQNRSKMHRLYNLSQWRKKGENIRRIKRKGLTQAKLAERVDISRLLISDYERGKVRLYAKLSRRDIRWNTIQKKSGWDFWMNGSQAVKQQKIFKNIWVYFFPWTF